MREILRGIADQLGYIYGFGTLEDLNVLADSLVPETQPLLFYVDYPTITLTPGEYGGIGGNSPLTFLLLQPGAENDGPNVVTARVDATVQGAIAVYKQLVNRHDLGQATLQPARAQTDRYLDGVQVNSSYSLTPFGLC